MSHLKKGTSALLAILMLGSAAVSSTGCLSLKTEHEVKPIHITMDINLKVDRQIDSYLDDIYGEIPEASAEAAAAK